VGGGVPVVGMAGGRGGDLVEDVWLEQPRRVRL